VAKQQLICDALRSQIVDGVLTPGTRLPTQVQLVEQFQVSGVTIQRALDRLVREGFICTRGRHGTFVTGNPPHLCNYGLVFVDQPGREEHRSRYHEMLESQAFRLQREGDRRVTVFDGISGREDEESSRQLLADVRAHRMAGLMLVDPDSLEGTAIVEEPGIARVAIMSRKVDLPGCPIVYPDIAGMIDLGLDTLVAQGCKRVAVLVTVPLYSDSGDYLRAASQRRPIKVEERWIQIAAHEMPDAVRNMVLLLMHPGNDERPDGIFVVDDNLAESTSRGLVDTGVRVPQDVKVVAHCNFPWSTPAVLPVQRVGFDTQEILDTALSIVDMQRQEQTPPAVTRVKAILQDPD
jgi:GntR family transcriptional regulator, arabinose operon transcriptional repressor